MQCYELTVNEHLMPQGWTSSVSPGHERESAATSADSKGGPKKGSESIVPSIDMASSTLRKYALSLTILQNP
jgi:hypothetical protein